MKKTLMTITALTTLFLNGCVTDPSGTAGNTALGTVTAIGSDIFKAAVDNQCRVALNNNTAFRTIALAMTAAQQSDLENSICGCVSEQALQNVSVVDLAQAATNPSFRNQLVVTVVGRSLNTCYSQFVRR